MKPNPNVVAMILKLANAPTGVTARDLGIRMSTAYANLVRMTETGELYCVAGGKGKPSRHFVSAAAAEKFRRECAEAQRAEQEKTATKAGHARAWWNSDAPAIETPATKYTIAPPPPIPVRTNTFPRW